MKTGEGGRERSREKERGAENDRLLLKRETAITTERLWHRNTHHLKRKKLRLTLEGKRDPGVKHTARKGKGAAPERFPRFRAGPAESCAAGRFPERRYQKEAD